MTLVHAAKGKLVFRVGDSEKSLLTTLLELYPRVTSAATLSSPSRKARHPKETEALLEEALADQRAQNKKQVKAFLADANRFEKVDDGWRFSLTPAEADWMLRVLNDIRIGSWVALGSPEERLDVLDQNNLRDFWAMEISGRFEAVLLEALSGGH